MKKILNFIFGLLIIITPIYADYDEGIYNLIDKYYSTFESFDMESYLQTQDLRAYTKDELEIKKNNINIMWENVEPQYHHIYNLNFTSDENIGIVSYELEAGMGSYNSNDEFNYEMEMTAILSKVDNKWKILKVLPSSQLDELIELRNMEKSFNTLNKSLNDNFVNETYLYINNETGDQNNNASNNFVVDEVNNDNKDELKIRDNLTIKLPTDNSNDNLNCEFNLEYIKAISGINIKEFVSDNIYDMLIGDFSLKILIDDDKNYIFEIDDGVLTLVNSTIKKIKYSVTTDSCTILAIHDKTTTPMNAYNNDLIKIKGETFTTKFKIGFGKIIYGIFNFFKSDNEIENIILEGEDFTLIDKGKYSFVGKTSRGPGELYLGTGGSSASIEFNSNSNKIVQVYIKITDDKLHKDNTRSVDLIFNDKIIKYNHISENTITPKSVWAWKYIGEVNIKKGNNELNILKPTQTSAAFIMDKIALYDKKIEISEIGN